MNRTVDFARFLPPLTIGDDLLLTGLDILEEAFAESRSLDKKVLS